MSGRVFKSTYHRRKHCQESGFEGERLYDGDLHRAENPALPRRQARQLQVTRQDHCIRCYAWRFDPIRAIQRIQESEFPYKLL